MILCRLTDGDNNELDDKGDVIFDDPCGDKTASGVDVVDFDIDKPIPECRRFEERIGGKDFRIEEDEDEEDEAADEGEVTFECTASLF